MRSLVPRRERAYALRTWDKPPTIETYLVHPFMEQSKDGSVTELGIAEVEEPATTRRPGQSNSNRCPLSTNHRPLAMPAASTPGPTAGALTLILCGCRRRWSGQGAVVDAGNLRPPEPAQRQSATARRPAPQGLPPPSAKQPAPPPELFDLLSLNEVHPRAPCPWTRCTDCLWDLILPAAASVGPVQ